MCYISGRHVTDKVDMTVVMRKQMHSYVEMRVHSADIASISSRRDRIDESCMMCHQIASILCHSAESSTMCR